MALNISVVPRTMQIVNSDGTVTRSGQLLLEQLSKAVTYGSHMDRPDPSSMPAGALYVEADRTVLYQNIDGHWQYIAGTMWGTITPDQRPKDLGVHDGGFDYRCTDVAREFMWSQTEWIEVTSVIYGIHSGRPNPATIVDGSLYVEYDRGSATYQEQAGAWKYVFGTMWGTLSPDQRPTDLGANDVGFDFRTSVAPRREFLWSGSAWVEITPVGGYLNLTHSNVVTKVDTTSGQIVEGGIIDLSAAGSGTVQITAGGSVGIGTGSPVSRLSLGNGTPNATQRFAVYESAAGMSCRGIGLVNPSAGGYGVGIWADTGANVPTDNNWHFLIKDGGGLVAPGLPSFNPGVGSKALWYDPADGNRVKFAP